MRKGERVTRQLCQSGSEEGAEGRAGSGEKREGSAPFALPAEKGRRKRPEGRNREGAEKGGKAEGEKGEEGAKGGKGGKGGSGSARFPPRRREGEEARDSGEGG